METAKTSVLWRELCEQLSTVSGEAIFELRQIFSQLAGITFPLEGELESKQAALLREAVSRRLAGEPLQYILQEWDFYGRTFAVGPGVLIPRADTETLIQAALDLWEDSTPPLMADLCSGSGCIAITMAAETGGEVFAVEKSRAALEYLRLNVKRHGVSVHVREDDVLIPAEEYPQFDMILSNPPYLTAEDMRTLQQEVRREPALALDGGEDGLHFYRRIPVMWKKWLKPGGWLLFEIGRGQEKEVEKLMQNECFENVCFFPDLCGIIRVIGGRYLPPGHNS